jgi:ferredoxin-thioredoxin reductase catalytic subunit
MKKEIPITEEAVGQQYARLKKEAESAGYHLNPDIAFTRELVRGTLTNTARYGYGSCPCRLASGRPEADLDIVCPCDYRDPDLGDYGACYCGLYVTEAVASGKESLHSIPERRPGPDARQRTTISPTSPTNMAFPVWRCRVCGYLCAREAPPEICPICKAQKERFERFM